uniref:SAM dependent methyltransferase n=1 Tax=Pithovirus LCDPAC02 TaxID=2506601 RepID=A0A481YNX7_9VIRU|nr:MAG: SAM dependent methyltransferase [Pithovirus LCDPAC02]
MSQDKSINIKFDTFVNFIKDYDLNIDYYLDIGAGDGKLSKKIHEYLKIQNKDCNLVMIDPYTNIDTEHDQIHIKNISELNLHDDIKKYSFGLITAFSAFHHVNNFEQTLEYIERYCTRDCFLFFKDHDIQDPILQVIEDIVHLKDIVKFGEYEGYNDFLKNYYTSFFAKDSFHNTLIWMGFKNLLITQETGIRFQYYSLYQFKDAHLKYIVLPSFSNSIYNYNNNNISEIFYSLKKVLSNNKEYKKLYFDRNINIFKFIDKNSNIKDQNIIIKKLVNFIRK